MSEMICKREERLSDGTPCYRVEYYDEKNQLVAVKYLNLEDCKWIVAHVDDDDDAIEFERRLGGPVPPCEDP